MIELATLYLDTSTALSWVLVTENSSPNLRLSYVSQEYIPVYCQIREPDVFTDSLWQ